MADTLDLVIRNAKVVTAGDAWDGDIGVAGGRIAALGHGLGGARQAIDAGGKLVMPGGIDVHCHIDQVVSSGLKTADDFRSGTISAAFGGTTTIIPFAAQQRGQSLRQTIEDYHALAEGKPVIDYGFHLIITDPTAQVLGQELPALIRDGYTSLKIYMTYDAIRLNDRQLIDVLAVARREGATAMIHAESHDLINWVTERLIGAGKSAPKYHTIARPIVAEREATHRAIAFAEAVDIPIYIVHVSSREAMEQIASAQARGLRIEAETCPQYLLLTARDLDRPGFEGAKYCCSPPPRDAANQEAMWLGIATGVFKSVSSDHSPFRFEDPKGKKFHGANAPFNQIPMGVPGIETRLPLLFSEGVGKGRISIHQFVEIAAAGPARIFGLYPRKGTIAVGSDADLAIWDPDRTVTIRHGDLHGALDYTPYEGREVKGWPVAVLSRGEVVCESGALKAKPGRGEFLRRARHGWPGVHRSALAPKAVREEV
jgi:dihydropyrimidinase